MKRLWFIVLFVCLIVSACSSKVYPDQIGKPVETSTLTFTPHTPTFAPTFTTVPTETLTPTEPLTPTITPQPTATEQITIPKILLLGDSLIVLTRVPKYFSQLLRDTGVPAEFVGDEFSSGNDVPADGLGGFDTGLMLKQLTSETVWTRLNGTQFPNNFDAHIPDIVVIQLGTNDAVNAAEGSWDPVPYYRKNMQKIIEFLRSRNPKVKIVVAMLIPSQWPEYTAKIDLINSAIPNFVTTMDTPDSRVVTTVNLKETWEDLDFSDNVHPNNSGSHKIAQAYSDALVNNHLVSAPRLP